MVLNERINALGHLQRIFQELNSDPNHEIFSMANAKNQWFIPSFVKSAIQHIELYYLNPNLIRIWVNKYDLHENPPLRIGIVCAGNIPLVCFHDFLCVFITGNISVLKLSDKDSVLLPFIFNEWILNCPEITDYFEFVERITGVDAIIATGSDNSATYFEHYFGKYPNIIRKNRTSVCILSGNESDEELALLGNDVFQYFGQGCRNISKIYIPENYDIEKLKSVWHNFDFIMDHNKYKNNFDYNYTLYLMNKIPHSANSNIIFTENKSLHSRIGVLHYEYYHDLEELSKDLTLISNQIQCILSNLPVQGLFAQPLGSGQKPKLEDYADGVDTIKFLQSLN
jgi:hypothetical protein